MKAEDIDRALAALPPEAPSPPPRPAGRVEGAAGAAVQALLRLAPKPPSEAEDQARERARQAAREARRARIAAKRAELEARPGVHPRLLEAVRRRPTPSALLLGPTGVGKTTAALWLRAGLAGPWRHARELAACERRHPLGEGEPPALSEACSAPVLYLDDLGTEDVRDVAVLQHVLERRYAAGLPTVTTTGLTRDQLTERYGAATVRRLSDQHARRPDGARWPVLVVDVHRLGGGA